PDQGPVQHTRKEACQVRALQGRKPGNLGRRVVVELGGKHRASFEQQPLSVVEQLITPPKRSFEREVPPGRPRRPVGQQRETVLEAKKQLRGRESTNTGSRQLDGQRQSVELPAQLRDVACVVRGDCETWRRRRRTVHKQPRRRWRWRGPRRRPAEGNQQPRPPAARGVSCRPLPDRSTSPCGGRTPDGRALRFPARVL